MNRPRMSFPDRRFRVPVLLITALTGVGMFMSTAARAGDVDYNYDVHGRLIERKTTNSVGDVVTVTNAYDSAGNRTSVTTSTVDPIAPTVPTGLAGSVISVNKINLTWNASTDGGGSGLAGYRIRRNGAVLNTSSATSYSDTSVVGSTTYQYTVAAYDGQGNESAQSSAITKSTPDITAPSVPGNLVAVAASPTWVNLSWNASTDTGGSGLAGYEIFRNGTLLNTSLTNSYADQSAVANSSYTYAVKAYDGSNNKSALSSAVSITTPNSADTTKPTVPTGLVASSSSSGIANLSWSPSSDPGTGASGVAGYQVYRGGAYLATTVGANATALVDNTVICGGSYSYQVRSFDNAAVTNYSDLSSAAGVTTPDTIGPQTPTGFVGSAPATNQVNLTWNPTSDVCTGVQGYRVYRNGGVIATTSGSSYTDTTTVANQTYSYRIQAFDASPLHNSSGLSVNVDLTPPDTILPSAPGTPTFTSVTGNTATASWTVATDNVAVTRYRYYLSTPSWNSGWIEPGNVLSVNLTGLTRSTTYTLVVQAGDAVNWATASSSSSFTTAPYYTSIVTMTPGTWGDGWSQPYQTGYIAGALGSLSPDSVYGGKTIGAYQTGYMLYFDGATWYAVENTSLYITGFSGNPGQNWLISITGAGSGASAGSFSCDATSCLWQWPTYLTSGLGGSITVQHQ